MAGSRAKKEVPRPQPQRQTGEVGVAPTLRSVRSCFLSSPSAVWPGLGRSDSPDCREALSPSEFPALSLASGSHGSREPPGFQGCVSEFFSP